MRTRRMIRIAVFIFTLTALILAQNGQPQYTIRVGPAQVPKGMQVARHPRLSQHIPLSNAQKSALIHQAVTQIIAQPELQRVLLGKGKIEQFPALVQIAKTEVQSYSAVYGPSLHFDMTHLDDAASESNLGLFAVSRLDSQGATFYGSDLGMVSVYLKNPKVGVLYLFDFTVESMDTLQPFTDATTPFRLDSGDGDATDGTATITAMNGHVLYVAGVPPNLETGYFVVSLRSPEQKGQNSVNWRWLSCDVTEIQ